MGIHGMGQAFNLQYQRRSNVNIHRSVPQYYNNQSIFPQYQMQPFQQTTQIEVQNGPGGFWGFMQGFTEQGGFQGLFDCLSNIFGGGKAKETQGATETPAPTSTTETPAPTSTTETPAPTSTTETPAPTSTTETPAPTSPGANDGWSPAGAGDLTDGAQIRVHDDVKGGGRDINGQTKLSDDKSDDGFPKTITVKGYTYEYKETKDGVAIYKSTSANAAGDEYRLEKNSDGTFGLNQYEGDHGAGSIDIGRGAGAKGGTGGTTPPVPKGYTRIDPSQVNKFSNCKNFVDFKSKLNGIIPNEIEFVKKNPSIFDSSGNIKSDANWSVLDLPAGVTVA